MNLAGTAWTEWWVKLPSQGFVDHQKFGILSAAKTRSSEPALAVTRTTTLAMPSFDTWGIKYATRPDLASSLPMRWYTEVNGIPVLLETSSRFRGPNFHIAERILMFVESSSLATCLTALKASATRTFSVPNISCPPPLNVTCLTHYYIFQEKKRGWVEVSRLWELQEWHDYVVAAPTACIASPNAGEGEADAGCHQGNQRGQHNLISWQEITSTRKRTRQLLNLLPNETEDRTVS